MRRAGLSIQSIKKLRNSFHQVNRKKLLCRLCNKAIFSETHFLTHCLQVKKTDLLGSFVVAKDDSRMLVGYVTSFSNEDANILGFCIESMTLKLYTQISLATIYVVDSEVAQEICARK